MLAKYPKHAAAVALAKATIGQQEMPLGSNTGPFVEKCQRRTWLAGTRWAWCRAYSLEIHAEAGFTLPDGSAGAWDALDRARKRGDALSPAQHHLAIPGDEVIWRFGAGHCSILTGTTVRNGVVYVQSIDGNVGDKVQPCERPLFEVKGFIHWREDAVSVVVKPPRRQIVGSISGRRQLVTKKGKVIQLPAKKPGAHGVVVPKPRTQRVKLEFIGKPKPPVAKRGGHQPTAQGPAPTKPPPKPAVAKKPAPKIRYYTRRASVKLAKGQTIGYTRGKGYYAKPAPKKR